MASAELKRKYALGMVRFAISRAKQASRSFRLEQGSDKPEYRRLRKESMQQARYWSQQLTA